MWYRLCLQSQIAPKCSSSQKMKVMKKRPKKFQSTKSTNPNLIATPSKFKNKFFPPTKCWWIRQRPQNPTCAKATWQIKLRTLTCLVFKKWPLVCSMIKKSNLQVLWLVNTQAPKHLIQEGNFSGVWSRVIGMQSLILRDSHSVLTLLKRLKVLRSLKQDKPSVNEEVSRKEKSLLGWVTRRISSRVMSTLKWGRLATISRTWKTLALSTSTS